MMRDDLLKKLMALPPHADVGIEIGNDPLDISDVVLDGDEDFAVLKCHAGDLHDVLWKWGLPARQREQLTGGRRTPWVSFCSPTGE